MSLLLFRTTLLRSNPQIIREFYLRDNLTVEDFFKVFLTVHNWDKPKDMKLQVWRALQNGNQGETAGINAAGTASISFPGDVTASASDSYLGDGAVSLASSGTVNAPEISTSLKNLTSNGTTMWLLEIPMEKAKAVYWYRDRKAENAAPQFWRFRIELIETTILEEIKPYVPVDALYGVETEEAFYAYLRDALWYHPWQKSGSLVYSNRMLSELEHEGRVITYDGTVIREDNMEVDYKQINQGFLPAENKTYTATTVQVRRDFAMPLVQLLGYSPIAELKQVGRNLKFNIQYNLKKANYIPEMAKNMDRPDFWEKILRTMEYPEYTGFRRYLLNTRFKSELGIKSVPVLKKYFLVQNIHDELSFPEELLDYYEQRMSIQGDDDLISEKRMRQVLVLAGQLYGLMRKDVCMKLYQILWEEEFDQNDFEKNWRLAYGKTQDPFIPGTSDLFYHALHVNVLCANDTFDRTEASQLLKKLSVYPASAYYMPDKEECNQILEQGIQFSGDLHVKIYKFVESLLPRYSAYYYNNSVPDILKKIYRYCQMQVSMSQIESRLIWVYHINFSNDQRKRFREFIRQAQPDVRRLDLLGYTENEWNKMNGTK